MRYLYILTAAALTLALLACNQAEPNNVFGDCPPATATPADAATPAAAGAPTDAARAATTRSSADFASDVVAAEEALVDHYVTHLNVRLLLKAAWFGAEASAARQNPVLPTGAAPEPFDLSAFVSVFESLLDAEPDARARQTLTDASINAMADSLDDDHTAYLPGNAFQLRVRGSAMTSGIVGMTREGQLLVTDVLPGSAAEAAGIKIGDLVQIDRRAPVAGPDPGAPLASTIQGTRQGAPLAPVEVISRPTTLAGIRTDVLEGDIGYLHLYQFPPISSCESFAAFRVDLDQALATLNLAHVDAFVLDLRDNPGGSELAAAYVAGRFGLDGRLATIYDRAGSPTPIETLGSAAFTSNKPIDVLVNARSTSASEMVAYALQDGGIARVVGDQTPGSVVAASTYPLPSGGMQITIATVEVGPGHHVLEKIGVTPNVSAALDADLLQSQGRDSQLEAALGDLKTRLKR